MKRHTVDLVVLVALATTVVLVLLGTAPGIRSITLHVYVLVIGLALMLALLAALGAALPRRRESSFDAALATPTFADTRLPGLERMEREVTLATTSAYDLHFRLLPHLREISAARLTRARLEAGPDTLGRWWELLRPDRPPPDDRFAAGIDEAELRELVADLARIGS